MFAVPTAISKSDTSTSDDRVKAGAGWRHYRAELDHKITQQGDAGQNTGDLQQTQDRATSSPRSPMRATSNLVKQEGGASAGRQRSPNPGGAEQAALEWPSSNIARQEAPIRILEQEKANSASLAHSMA